MNQFLALSTSCLAPSAQWTLRKLSSNRCRLLSWSSIASGISTLLLLASPLMAQNSPRTLGGPRVNVTDASIVIRSQAKVSSIANTPATMGNKAANPPPAKATPHLKDIKGTAPTLVAQTQTAPAAGTDEKENPPPGSAQGALPVDLGLIRRLKVTGKLIDEAPMRVGNLDILAPIVAECPNLGVSVTRASLSNIPGNPNTPTEDKIFQINLPQGPPIVMTVGKTSVYINQVEQQLRAAPLVIRDKIWLPIYSIAPLLGASIRLEPDGTLNINPTIQSVELFPVKNMVALTIKTSAPLAPGKVLMGTLDDPPKLYLDFSGYSMGFDAANSTGERVVSAGLGDVTKVRAGMFQSFPDITRVVLDLKRGLKAVTQPLPDKTLFALVLVPPGSKSSSNMAAPAMFGSGPLDPNNLRGLTIVVDAGHGGHDFGARGSKSYEKNHTLDIARRVANNLRNRGATVLMTREGDYFVTLQGRVDFANTRKADIFFSVHINYYYKPESAGTETYFYTAHSLALAREVHKELIKATGLKNRGVLQERLFVIRKTTMPSVLTETAFISNAREESLLINPTFRERVANGMAQGIVNYVNQYMRPGGTPG